MILLFLFHLHFPLDGDDADLRHLRPLSHTLRLAIQSKISALTFVSESSLTFGIFDSVIGRGSVGPRAPI